MFNLRVCVIELDLIHRINLQNLTDNLEIPFFFRFVFEFDPHFRCSRYEIEKVPVVSFKWISHITFLPLHLGLVELLFEFFIWCAFLICHLISFLLLNCMIIILAFLNINETTWAQRSILLLFNFYIIFILILH